MNTVEKGDKFENEVFDFIKEHIESGNSYLNPALCSFHKKKGYYSDKRKKNIIFDISIECYRKGSNKYSQLIIIECKDYNSPIPVDDIEEFESKLRQVTGVNIKGMFFSRSAFQSGALQVAQSIKMALIRVLPDNQVEWILERKPLASSLLVRANEDEQLTIRGLLDNDYIGLSQNIFNYYNDKITTSFTDTFNKLVFIDSNLDKFVSQNNSFPYRNSPKKTLGYVSYDDLDSRSFKILEYSGNDNYPIDFLLLTSSLTKNCGVEFDFESDLGCDPRKNTILGTMDIKRNLIKISNKLEYNSHSWRFALGHEIGHYILHSGYILNLYNGQYSEIESNLSWNKDELNKNNVFNRLEWQANTFANCLLMPKNKLSPLVMQLAKDLGITNFSNGVIYLDDQQCNVYNYKLIISKLKKEFNVSASIATIRLKQLRILNDVRKVQSAKSLFGKNFSIN